VSVPPQERARPYAVANGQVVQGDTFIGAVRAADLLNDQAARLAAVEAARAKDCVEWEKRVQEQYQARLRDAGRLRAVEAALRETWFREPGAEVPGLLDMDYEVAPGDGLSPDWENPRWAWQGHPWLELAGITEDECHAFFDARNAAARAALGSEGES